MLKGNINFEGKTLADVMDAISEATKRIEGGNVVGMDKNEDGQFYFNITGEDADDIAERRRQEADESFESFDFGNDEGLSVGESEGWETSTDEPNVMRRTVYIEDEAEPDADSVKKRFAVVFEPDSSVITESYSYDG